MDAAESIGIRQESVKIRAHAVATQRQCSPEVRRRSPATADRDETLRRRGLVVPQPQVKLDFRVKTSGLMLRPP